MVRRSSLQVSMTWGVRRGSNPNPNPNPNPIPNPNPNAHDSLLYNHAQDQIISWIIYQLSFCRCLQGHWIGGGSSLPCNRAYFWPQIGNCSIQTIYIWGLPISSAFFLYLPHCWHTTCSILGESHCDFLTAPRPSLCCRQLQRIQEHRICLHIRHRPFSYTTLLKITTIMTSIHFLDWVSATVGASLLPGIGRIHPREWKQMPFLVTYLTLESPMFQWRLNQHHLIFW